MRLVERLVGSERGKGTVIHQEVQGGCPLPRFSNKLMFPQTYEGGYSSAPGCEAQGSHLWTHCKGSMWRGDSGILPGPTLWIAFD